MTIMMHIWLTKKLFPNFFFTQHNFRKCYARTYDQNYKFSFGKYLRMKFCLIKTYLWGNLRFSILYTIVKCFTAYNTQNELIRIMEFTEEKTTNVCTVLYLIILNKYSKQSNESCKLHPNIISEICCSMPLTNNFFLEKQKTQCLYGISSFHISLTTLKYLILRRRGLVLHVHGKRANIFSMGSNNVFLFAEAVYNSMCMLYVHK